MLRLELDLFDKNEYFNLHLYCTDILQIYAFSLGLNHKPVLSRCGTSFKIELDSPQKQVFDSCR